MNSIVEMTAEYLYYFNQPGKSWEEAKKYPIAIEGIYIEAEGLVEKIIKEYEAQKKRIEIANSEFIMPS